MGYSRDIDLSRLDLGQIEATHVHDLVYIPNNNQFISLMIDLIFTDERRIYLCTHSSLLFINLQQKSITIVKVRKVSKLYCLHIYGNIYIKFET